MESTRGLAKKRPVLFAVLCTVLAMLIWAVELDGDPIGGVDMIVSHSLTSIIALFLMSLLMILPTAGFRKKGFLQGLALGIPFYILGIASAIFSNPEMDLSLVRDIRLPSLLSFTLSMFMVGIGEEVLFRGLLLNNFLDVWKDTKNGTLRAVWVSAAIFGAVHLLNMVVAPPLTVLVQTINAASAGVLFAAIYIRCRNLWSVIIVHTLVDWLALAPQQLLPQASSIVSGEVTVIQALMVVLVGSAVPLFVAWLLLRKKGMNA